MKKSTNKNVLAGARIKKDPTRDEFYTLPETAEGLLQNIPDEFFFGKTVYCSVRGDVFVNGKHKFWRVLVKRKK